LRKQRFEFAENPTFQEVRNFQVSHDLEGMQGIELVRGSRSASAIFRQSVRWLTLESTMASELRLLVSPEEHFMNRRTLTLLTLLTLVNLGILGFLLLHRTRIVEANSALPVLRGSGLEIVDAQGKVRASIQLVPAGPAIRADGSVVKDGKIYPETVRFRLIRADGRPSVKITTSEQGSGLTLGGGIDPTYIVLSADGGDPTFTLTNKDGRRQIIKP
jgi:hypothetical protein